MPQAVSGYIAFAASARAGAVNATRRGPASIPLPQSPVGASGRGSPAVGSKAGHSHIRTLFFRLDRPGGVGTPGGNGGGASIV
jgi:hypothetical protein